MFVKATVAGIVEFLPLYPDRLEPIIQQKKSCIWDTWEYSVRKRDCISVRKGLNRKYQNWIPKEDVYYQGEQK